MQNNNRYSKYIALVALLISIVGVTLGFAAYSNTVSIKARADVSVVDPTKKPGVLSTSPTEQVDGSVTPTTENGATAEVATLTDDQIEGIMVHFTATGQSATYTFNVYNPTEFTGYLKRVGFGTKQCTASTTSSNPATQGIADACEDITMRIIIDDTDEYIDTEDSITGKSLASHGHKEVKVIVDYIENGRTADGDFDVNFGTSTINYSTVD